MITTAYLVYFSPTGTTRKISTRIARGLGTKNVVHHDMTLPASRRETVLADGVAIVGIPVYAGRVPELFLQRLQTITSQGVPAILVALYGNREYEDALIELSDVCTLKGFNVIAAGAFIGEHSYSTASQPIAPGRPDARDLKLAEALGKRAAAKIAGNDFTAPVIDGNVPYRQRVLFGGVSPETSGSKCTLCGKCAAVCPAGVITASDMVTTSADRCIMCCACIRSCAFAARTCTHPQIEEKRAMLSRNCRSPKAPETFI